MTIPARLIKAHEAITQNRIIRTKMLHERLERGENLKRAAHAVGVSYTSAKRYRRSEV